MSRMLDIAGGIIIAVALMTLFWGGLRLLRQDELRWIQTLDKVFGVAMIIVSLGLMAAIMFFR